MAYSFLRVLRLLAATVLSNESVTPPVWSAVVSLVSPKRLRTWNTGARASALAYVPVTVPPKQPVNGSEP